MKRILTHNIYRSAEKYPDHIAFKQLDFTMSYEQLVYKSHQMAHMLLELGVEKGDRIGICMNRSIESTFSTYGIMLAGAAYVPIDSNLPVQRIGEIIADCGIRILLTNDTFSAKVEEVCEKPSSLKFVIGLNELKSSHVQRFSWEDVHAQPHATPSVNSSEEDMAYVMCTSGTTGKQKGIVHTHYSGFSYAKLSAELYELTAEDILGNHSQLHYDISTMGYLTMPYVGGCSVIIPEAHTIFPSSMSQLIESEKMTIWYSVPLALIQLLKGGSLADRDLSSVRYVLFGGEPFAIKHLKALFNYMPKAKFSNVYGPAEVNQCTFYNFDAKTELNDIVPIGRAWPETEVRVLLNEAQTEQDHVGELIVTSSTQMKEYWGQPELTKSRLISMKSSQGELVDFYKTGDIVRKLENGDLLFVGREDRQIKVRGYRVELNEIENVLLSNHDIAEAAVFAKKEEDAWAIFADVILNNKELQASDIMKYMAKRLPNYALPSEIRITDSIPRTNAGKVDYKALK